MSVWLFALAAIVIVLGGIYFSFTPIDVAARGCPNCGGKTRYHDPFWMCDACEMLVGVSVEAIWRDLRLARTGRNEEKGRPEAASPFNRRSIAASPARLIPVDKYSNLSKQIDFPKKTLP
jgi:hypothetical protein